MGLGSTIKKATNSVADAAKNAAKKAAEATKKAAEEAERAAKKLRDDAQAATRKADAEALAKRLLDGAKAAVEKTREEAKRAQDLERLKAQVPTLGELKEKAGGIASDPLRAASQVVVAAYGAAGDVAAGVPGYEQLKALEQEHRDKLQAVGGVYVGAAKGVATVVAGEAGAKTVQAYADVLSGRAAREGGGGLLRIADIAASATGQGELLGTALGIGLAAGVDPASLTGWQPPAPPAETWSAAPPAVADEAQLTYTESAPSSAPAPVRVLGVALTAPVIAIGAALVLVLTLLVALVAGRR